MMRKDLLSNLPMGKRTKEPQVLLHHLTTYGDRDAAARLGVTSYIRKPVDLEEFMEVGGKLKSVLRPEPE